jgi:hypothetical protein
MVNAIIALRPGKNQVPNLFVAFEERFYHAAHSGQPHRRRR